MKRGLAVKQQIEIEDCRVTFATEKYNIAVHFIKIFWRIIQPSSQMQLIDTFLSLL